MMQQALRYQRMGLSVIPLRPRSKEPLIKWQEYQTRRATVEEIKAWWKKSPDANIGIITGGVSGLVAVDMDGVDAISYAKNIGLNSSIISKTGSGIGQHNLFKYSGEEPKRLWKGNREHEEIFLRSDGEYIVAPPSIHPNGKRYHFVTALNVGRLSVFPKVKFVEDVSPVLQYEVKEPDWISQALEEMENGHTHNNLVSVLGKFRFHNFSQKDVFELLRLRTSKGGMSDDELQAKISEIWGRYESKSSRTDISYGKFEGSLFIHSPSNPESKRQFDLRSVNTENAQGTKTGYPKLDAMLTGGLKSSRLFTLAARTGVGKTNWVLGVTKSLCESGKRVLLFSTEMSYEEIWSRYIPTLKDPEEFERHQFYICDSFAPNLEKVEEAIKMINPDVFIFDHINHVSEDVKPLGEFMQGLNYLRRKYDVAGIVTAQLNRLADWVDMKTGEKVTPRISMIKGSGTIEQASSRVLLLSEKRVTSEMTEIVGNLDKNDNGTKGLLHFGLVNNPWRIVEL